MKICSICNIEKELDKFVKRSKIEYKSYCNDCRRLRRKRYNNPIIISSKLCKFCNKDLNIILFHKDKNSPDGVYPKCKLCRKEDTSQYYNLKKEEIKVKTNKYYHNNKEKLRISSKKYTKQKRETDSYYVLQRRLRNRIYYALRRQKLSKTSKFKDYIGCTLDELKQHIEKQFIEDMTWDKLFAGKIHIDHIIPLNSAQTEEEMYKLCHYTNLQPLWAIDNIKKADKVLQCWQKSQRDRYLKEDIENGYPTNIKAKNFILQKEEFTSEHREFIERYEWLGTIGFSPKYVFTARYNNLLGGVVIIGEPTNYQFNKELEALIQRGACASWTPKNLNSRLVMFSCKWMVKYTNKRIFTAYCDFEAGEIGTIYQACNFDYLGDGFGADYKYITEDGKKVSSRYFTGTSAMKKWARALGITWQKEWSKDNGFQNIHNIPVDIKNKLNEYANNKMNECIKVKEQSKGKYVLLLKRNNKESIIKHWISLSYPKRSN